GEPAAMCTAFPICARAAPGTARNMHSAAIGIDKMRRMDHLRKIWNPTRLRALELSRYSVALDGAARRYLNSPPGAFGATLSAVDRGQPQRARRALPSARPRIAIP